MSHYIAKQAIPTEFLEQIRADQKLQKLIYDLWSYGSDMFLWFQIPSPTASGYIRESAADVFKQDYRADFEAFGESENSQHFYFESEKELESYCVFLEQRLAQLSANDPSLVQRKAYLGTRTDEQIYSSLLKVLSEKFPALDDAFATEVVAGGEKSDSNSDLRWLASDRVSEVARVLSEIEVDELIRHFDRSQPYSAEMLEECRKAGIELKTCFIEAAQKEQVILTAII